MVGEGIYSLRGQEATIYLARTIFDLILPPSGLLIVSFMGLLLLRKHKNTGRALIISGLLCMYLLSTSVVKNLLILPLETGYPPLRQAVQADAIVILTNGVTDLSHLQIEPRPDMYSLERTVQGYVLYERLRNVPVIISGGRADPGRPNLSIGQSLERAAIEMGIPRKDLLLEDDSLNTYEGALKVASILKGKGNKVVLVTSGFHMGRSVKLYRKAGLTVFPAPTNFQGEPLSLSPYSFIPMAHNLEVSSIALYEYICNLWYIVAFRMSA